ncbi:hypothetical protein [Sulfobacillus thermosulfidooxidans]|uniref:hypothetical protein n=1 Tax=Sulfobacillus thermosulfidooxidans TaxID=28034 RepID=UPI0006B5C88D|nr:hypothetical protein [Sulfobacillus thermosulfidooxidans]
MTIVEAFDHFLDEIHLITQRATRCPLGLSDPAGPQPGWAYSLAGDPGHDFAERVQRTTWHHDALVHLWYRDLTGRVVARWIWDVSYWEQDGWGDSWYIRTPRDMWRRIPDDFLVLWMTMPDAVLPRPSAL